jgi:hypothetical protein
LSLSPRAARHLPLTAHRLGLISNVAEKGGMTVALQPLLDEGSEDDLEAHRQLEGDGGPSRHDTSAVQDVLGENEQDLHSCFTHHHLRIRCAPGWIGQRVRGQRRQPVTSIVI